MSILREAHEGKATILEVCHEANISEVTLHRWKRELGMFNLDLSKRLKELEKANARLNRMLADEMLGKSSARAACRYFRLGRSS